MSDWEDMCGWLGISNDEFAADKVINLNSRTNTENLGWKRHLHKNNFDTFQDAIAWAKENPGKAIKRAPTGNGFIEA
ncbi:hypothetical protein D3C84_970970 [compost metagenome]